MKITGKNLICLSLAVIMMWVQGCASGNSLVAGPTDAQVNAEAAKAYSQIKAKATYSRNPQWNAIVQRVAHRIEVASGAHFQWQAVLIKSPEVNAWCMPGGKIAVYTGIMPVVKTEGALAAVLGHEVAHAVLHHGRKRMARAIQDQYAGLLIGGATALAGQLLCRSRTCRLLTALGGAAAGFAITFFELKYTRSQESQADEYGQIFMARAGYDPAEAVRLWVRMDRAMHGNEPPEWLSDHPSDANRRERLLAWLPRAEQIYHAAANHYGTGVLINAR